jgi:hypothetical protein
MGTLLWQADAGAVLDLRLQSGLMPQVTLFNRQGVELQPPRAQFGLPLVQEDFWTCDEVYFAQSFVRLTKPGPWTTLPMHTLFWQAGRTAFGLRAQGTIVRTTSFFHRTLLEPETSGLAREEWQQYLVAASLFRLGMLLSIPTTQRYWPFATPWPVLMASALLHCKNVTRERVEPLAALSAKQQRKLAKHGAPAPVTYDVLRLRVPQEQAAPGGHTPAAPTRPGVRFHLCRGHFKQLTHPRYKEPGLYWWPAHWRGDPALGVTLKDYALAPA